MPLSTYLPEHMGSATLAPPGPFVAGSHAELTLTYTAGTFGIDDSGMLKVSWRTTSDMAKPQFTEPSARQLHDGRGEQRRQARVLDRPPQHPALGEHAADPGRPRLPARRRDHHRALRRPPRKARRVCGCRPIARSASRSRSTSMPSRPTSSPSFRVSPGFALVPGPGGALEGDPAVAGRRRASRSAWPSSPRTCGAIRPRIERPLALVVIAADARTCPTASPRPRSDGPIVLDDLTVAEPGDVELRARAPRRGEELARANPLRVVATRAAAALLGRPARPERRDGRHQSGRKLFPLRPRQGLRRHRRTPGQRLPDHRCVLAGAQPPHGRVRRARALRLRAGLRMVGQHRHGRRPQRLLPPRRPPDPSLVAHSGRPDRTAAEATATPPQDLFGALAGRGRGRHRPCRRALCRHPARARRPPRARRRGAFHLGHVRMAAARRVRAGLSRRRRVPQRRPQGPAGRHAAGRLDVRRDRRPDLLSDARADARRAVRGAAPAAALWNDRHAPLHGRARHVRRSRSSASPTIRSWVRHGSMHGARGNDG